MEQQGMLQHGYAYGEPYTKPTVLCVCMYAAYYFV